MKTKLFTLACLLFMATGFSFSQTYLSGTISKDSVLTLAKSPYVVTSNLSVMHGDTLTIESGVVVQFNYCSLFIYGVLNATGVSFTSSQAVPAKGDWDGIYVGYQYGDPSSGLANLNNCQISYANAVYLENGSLIMSNGTSVQNMNNYGLYINDVSSGKTSTADLNNVSFNATNYGIYLYSGQNISLNNVAFTGGTTGIFATSWSNMNISNVTISNFTDGIWTNQANILLNNISINSCTRWPVRYDGTSNYTLTGTNTFSNNTNNIIYINYSELYDSLVLPHFSIPYQFSYSFTVHVGAKMMINDSCILKFNDYAELNSYGSLKAIASPGSLIYFTTMRDDNLGGDSNNDGTASSPSSSNWYGIYLYSGTNIMRRCEVRYAGYYQQGGINIVNASPTIDSCNFKNNYYGAYISGASSPIFTNNTIGSSQMTPIAMSFEADPVFVNNIFSFSDNTYDAIGLLGGTLSADAVLKIRSVTNIQNVTYLMLNNITVPLGNTLTINKGVVIKGYTGYSIVVNGKLIANASADSMIVFTSAKDDNYGHPGDTNKDGTQSTPATGDWGGIIFAPGSSDSSVMNYCRVQYANIPYYTYYSQDVEGSAIDAVNSNPTISNCVIKNVNYGISCYQAAKPIISNDTLINTKYTPFAISGSADPVFTGNVFVNPGWAALGLIGGNVSLNGTIKKRNVAGFNNITYILLSDLTINSGTYLEVDSGVVIKMQGTVFVDGGFRTNGTATSPVTFTSIKDDNVGNPGDTNGDGNATSPTYGDWGAIVYDGGSDDAYNNIKYAVLKYAGSSYWDYYCYCWPGGSSVRFDNSSGKITNSLITSSTTGISCEGNSAPVIDGLTIQNGNSDPIAMSLTSNPSFANITLTANASTGIRLIEGTLSSDATLSKRSLAGISNISYLIDHTLTVSSNATFTIEPGVVIKYKNSSPINVNGTLVAIGTTAEKIIFTSFADDSRGGDANNNGSANSPNKGDIGGINFINSNTGNILRNCEISYGGYASHYAAIDVENTYVVIDSCLIQQSSGYGVSIIGSANPSISNSQFYNIVLSPVYMSMFSNPVFQNITALNIGRMALTIQPETYSQSATVPIRSFAGYDTITYYLDGASTINSGTTITIPAGITFKTINGCYYCNNTSLSVNGRINIIGTAGKPVVFTDYRDDNYGNPRDMNQDGNATYPALGYYNEAIHFNDVSDDSSIIRNTLIRYFLNGIGMYSAAPKIVSSTFEYDQTSIYMTGVSTPAIDSCVFRNSGTMDISLVSYPSSTVKDTLIGTTWKGIYVLDETLTQDITLPQRTFAGIKNIPYIFNHYTIGTGATLTIQPGVICKFGQGGQMYVNKGFIAEGGSSADSAIVFTSVNDDSYGGDTNADGTTTTPSPDYWNGAWQGISFDNQSLDPLCRLKNCIIKYSYNGGVNTTNASPSIKNCNFSNNASGVIASGASNPVINYCDFKGNTNFGVNNVDKSFVIDATNCWWGDNSGPSNLSNPGGTGDVVSDAVNYSPWLTHGANNPLTGDVSLNGTVTAYDASLILQYAVALISLDTTQVRVADVSGNGSVTAYDASLILQEVVGIIQTFPADQHLKSAQVVSQPSASLSFTDISANSGDEITIPVKLSDVQNVMGLQTQLSYDNSLLTVKKIEFTGYVSSMNPVSGVNSSKGEIRLAMAGAYALNDNGTIANIVFAVSKDVSGNKHTQVKANQILVNEFDMTGNGKEGNIDIIGSVTGINNVALSPGEIRIYPNPFNSSATISYAVSGGNSHVTIEVYDVRGSKLAILTDVTVPAGTYSLIWKGTDSNNQQLASGIYAIKITNGDNSRMEKVQIIR